MIITGDIANKTWSTQGLDAHDKSLSLYFCFNDNGNLPIVFDNFGFGYTLYLGKKKVSEQKRPHEGMSYVRTDQEVLELFIEDNLAPEKTYKLSLWAENGGEIWQQDVEFTMPKLVGPYPSWIYNEAEEMWEAPAPYPDSDEIFYWDEETKSWVVE